MRLLAIAAALGSMVGAAAAQDYPTRPINVIVPAAAGGPTDAISRITTQAMSKILGQQITIENAGGAGGTIGTGRVVRADPDGYTLLIYHVGLATAATLYRKLPYDTKSAFAAIGLVTEAPMTIIGRLDLPPDSLKDLVAYLKGAGAKTTVANAGIGSASHLCGMLLMSQLQVTLTTVPYRGTGPVMNDLLGKQVDMTCDQATNTTGPILSKIAPAFAARASHRRRSRSQRLRARGLARRVRAAWHAPRDRGKAFHGADRRVKRSRSGEALPRDQHRADARRQGYAGSRAANSYKRDRPLGADYQGGRRIRGLVPIRPKR